VATRRRSSPSTDFDHGDADLTNKVEWRIWKAPGQNPGAVFYMHLDRWLSLGRGELASAIANAKLNRAVKGDGISRSMRIAKFGVDIACAWGGDSTDRRDRLSVENALI
jgi:hypothetical protein